MLNCVTASAINVRFCETDTVSIFLFPFLVVLGKPRKPGIWGEGLEHVVPGIEPGPGTCKACALTPV